MEHIKKSVELSNELRSKILSSWWESGSFSEKIDDPVFKSTDDVANLFVKKITKPRTRWDEFKLAFFTWLLNICKRQLIQIENDTTNRLHRLIGNLDKSTRMNEGAPVVVRDVINRNTA